VIAEVRPNLSILPSDKSTERVRTKIKDEPYGEETFGQSLKEQTKNLFDVVLLDLAPGLDVLHLAGLVASDYVIIPTRLRFMELDGVSEIMRSVQEIKRHGHTIRGVYLLPTFFDRTTRETIVRLKELVSAFPAMVWPPIVNDIRVAEAPAYGKTLWEYAPECNALLGYHNREGMRLGGYSDTLARVSALLEEL
jgi:chromosome partitioning protein